MLRGVARWEPGDAPDTAEVALVVEDAWQGRGLGTHLFRELLSAAGRRDLRAFCADVLAERMLRLLRGVAVVRESSVSHGVVHVCFVPRDASPEGGASRSIGRPPRRSCPRHGEV